MRLPIPQLPNILTADFNNLPDAVGNVEHALFHNVLTANKVSNSNSYKTNDATDKTTSNDNISKETPKRK